MTMFCTKHDGLFSFSWKSGYKSLESPQIEHARALRHEKRTVFKGKSGKRATYFAINQLKDIKATILKAMI